MKYPFAGLKVLALVIFFMFAYQISPTHELYNFIPKTVMVREEGIPNLNFTALP